MDEKIDNLINLSRLVNHYAQINLEPVKIASILNISEDVL